MMIINNNVQDTMVRYLGDNPVNFMLDKKSLRIKTRKREIYNKKGILNIDLLKLLQLVITLLLG